MSNYCSFDSLVGLCKGTLTADSHSGEEKVIFGQGPWRALQLADFHRLHFCLQEGLQKSHNPVSVLLIISSVGGHFSHQGEELLRAELLIHLCHTEAWKGCHKKMRA